MYIYGFDFSLKKKLISALDIDENEMKVCLKDNEVTHRFYYVEDWIDEPEKKEATKIPTRSLRGCYFGKFVSLDHFFVISFTN